MAVQCSVGGEGEDLLVALTGELGLPVRSWSTSPS
jgi:hypothetical protein